MMPVTDERPAFKRKNTLTSQKTNIEAEPVTTPWTPEEAAEFLGVTVGTLQVWRTTKRYPLPYLKIGRKVMYDPATTKAFRKSCFVGKV